MWSHGQLITRREVLNDGRSWMQVPVRVVLDDDELLATYIARGAPFTFPPGDWPTGNGLHPWHGKAAWEGHGLLMLQRPGESYAIWIFWFDAEREFRGWYINFQEPFRRTPTGYDTQDLELDIWLPREGGWVLKDDDLLDVRVREGRFTQDQARAIRREAARITSDLDAGRRWWDDVWAEWSPPVA
jgi:hypothetical protein